LTPSPKSAWSLAFAGFPRYPRFLTFTKDAFGKLAYGKHAFSESPR